MAATIEGLEQIESKHPVEETLRRVLSLLGEKGIKVFAVVDHSGEAAAAGLSMPPTKLVIFGSPKAGTPLMQAAPSTAIDLPLKALIWEDESGKVWLGWNASEYLQKRHGFPAKLASNLAGAIGLLRKAME